MPKASKRPVVKRKKLPSIQRLRKKLWELCRAITEKRYKDICFTCGRPVSGSNRQLGHFIPSSIGGAVLRYNLENLRWQCYYDNINLGGHGAEYYRRLVLEIGQDRVDELFKLKNKIVKADRSFYDGLIEEYSAILESYGTSKKG